MRVIKISKLINKININDNTKYNFEKLSIDSNLSITNK